MSLTTDTPTPGRLLAIGDIHGCHIALGTLIKAIDLRPEDTIVVLGDVIDWGPDSRDCVRQLIDLSSRFRVVPILGNHEELMLQSLDSDSALRSWLDLGGDRTLLSYPYDGINIIDPAHVEFVRGFGDYHETGDFIFTHAGFDPDLPMSRQPSLKLRWKFLDPALQRPHASGKTAVVGHTPQPGGDVLDLGHVICIDTDCSRGGWLSALEVWSGTIIQANQKGELRESNRRKARAKIDEIRS
jgi:serine/threonine protein phosphatase 1